MGTTPPGLLPHSTHRRGGWTPLTAGQEGDQVPQGTGSPRGGPSPQGEMPPPSPSYGRPPGRAPPQLWGTGCCRGEGVAWEGCLSCSISRESSSSASWAGDRVGHEDKASSAIPTRAEVGTEHAPPQCLSPSFSPEGLGGLPSRRGAPAGAHLHGCKRRLGCLLAGEVDKGTAPVRQQPDEPDLPEPGGGHTQLVPTPEILQCSPGRVWDWCRAGRVGHRAGGHGGVGTVMTM